MDPSVKPQHISQLHKQVTMVVDSNLELNEGWVRLNLNHGQKADLDKDFDKDDLQDEIEENSKDTTTYCALLRRAKQKI